MLYTGTGYRYKILVQVPVRVQVSRYIVDCGAFLQHLSFETRTSRIITSLSIYCLISRRDSHIPVGDYADKVIINYKSMQNTRHDLLR